MRRVLVSEELYQLLQREAIGGEFIEQSPREPNGQRVVTLSDEVYNAVSKSGPDIEWNIRKMLGKKVN